MKKYRITLTEEQLMLVANCVEDCHRFICGQTDLHNTISHIEEFKEGGWFMFGIDSCLWQGVAIKYVHQIQQVLRLAGMTELANNFKI